MVFLRFCLIISDSYIIYYLFNTQFFFIEKKRKINNYLTGLPMSNQTKMLVVWSFILTSLFAIDLIFLDMAYMGQYAKCLFTYKLSLVTIISYIEDFVSPVIDLLVYINLFSLFYYQCKRNEEERVMQSVMGD